MKPNRHADTIVAISTPPGEGAIGIVRLSGPRSLELAQKFFIPRRNKIIPFQPVLGDFTVPSSMSLRGGPEGRRSTPEKIDQALFLYFPSPRSYTGEEVVELHTHGSPAVLRRAVAELLAAGARLADPGEFTKRAFLNGKLDLAQAEAVASLISAKTELAARAARAQLEGSLSRQVEELRREIVEMFVYVEAAIDYPEEDLELLDAGQLRRRAAALIERVTRIRDGAQSGKLLRQGVQVVIAGKPNVGKSSLMNALLNEERSIVTPVPGTTRDLVAEFSQLDGIPVRYVDTAGIRESGELVEREGIRRSRRSLEQADIALVVCDGSSPLTAEDREILKLTEGKNRVLALNKSDLPPHPGDKPPGAIPISAKDKTGLAELRAALLRQITQGNGFFSHEHFMLSLRHEEALRRAEESLRKAAESLDRGLSGEFAAVDLRAALDALGEIVGETTTDDILEKIFSTFCIGK